MTLLEIPEAIEQVTQSARSLERLPPLSLPISDAEGHVLAEDIVADFDHPPFDQSLRDGVAFAGQSTENPLRICQTVLAGQSSEIPVPVNQAAIVMTGSPLPPGTDTVEMVEHVNWQSTSTTAAPVESSSRWSGAEEASHVHLERSFDPGQFVLAQGAVYLAGQALLAAGRRLTPGCLGLLASAGKTQVAVLPKPKVAVLITGDEIREPGAALAPGQIYNSNGPLLESLIGSCPVNLVDRVQIPDDEARLSQWLEKTVVQCDLIITTGSVSAGQRDLLPGIFAKLGVDCRFHGVRMKPGKPIWFGSYAKTGKPSCLVLGLPGNPVSTWVGFQVFVRRLLDELTGHNLDLPFTRAKLAEDFRPKGDRPTLWPAQWTPGSPFCRQEANVRPCRWNGSPDLKALATANCLIYFQPGADADSDFTAGADVEVLLI